MVEQAGNSLSGLALSIDAIEDLLQAFSTSAVPDALTDDRYYNVKLMQRIQMT